MGQFGGAVLDVAHDARSRLGHIVEIGVLEHPLLQDGKEDLDLVDPRRMNRRVYEMKAVSVLLVELGPALVGPAVVRVEVVPDGVELAIRIQYLRPSTWMGFSSTQ